MSNEVIRICKKHELLVLFVTLQTSMNAMKPARVTLTPTALIHQDHMSATVPPVIREMLHIAKVNITCYQFLSLLLSKAN